MAQISLFLAMAAFQDIPDVQAENLPQLSSVQFSLQASVLNCGILTAIFVIVGNGYHPRWLTTCSS